MKTFYFNTGVKPDGTQSLYGRQVWRGGTKQIPFDVADTVPDDAELLFLCSNPDLPEGKRLGVIVEPVFNTDMCSAYAYFKTHEKKGS